MRKAGQRSQEHHGDGEKGLRKLGEYDGGTRQGQSQKPGQEYIFGCLRQGLRVSSALGDTIQGQQPRPGRRDWGK